MTVGATLGGVVAIVVVAALALAQLVFALRACAQGNLCWVSLFGKDGQATHLSCDSGNFQFRRCFELEVASERRATIGLSIISWLLATVAAAILWNALIGQERWMGWRQDWIFVVSYATVLLIVQFPNAMRDSLRRSCMYSFVMAVLILTVSPMITQGDAKQVHMCFRAMFPIQIVAPVLTGSVILVGIWTFLYANAIVLAVHSAPPVLSWSPLIVMEEQYAIGLVVVLGCAWYKQLSDAEVESRLRAEASLSENNANKSLLATMCDAVLELNEDLTLVDDCPQLGVMLLHGGSARTNKGQDLQQFLSAADDRTRFKGYMDSSPVDRSGGLAMAFHSRMRDGLGNTLHVEMFHVPSTFLDGKRKHVLGIREQRDQYNANPGEDLQVVRHAPAGRRRVSSVRESQQGRLEDCTGASRCQSAHQHPKPLRAICDPMTLSVREATTGLQQLLGTSLEGESIVQAFSQRSDAKDFCNELLDKVASLIRSGDMEAGFTLPRLVSLKVPSSTSSSFFPCWATCGVVVWKVTSESSGLDTTLLASVSFLAHQVDASASSSEVSAAEVESQDAAAPSAQIRGKPQSTSACEPNIFGSAQQRL